MRVLMPSTASTAGTVGTAGLSGMASTAATAPMAGFYTGAPMLNIQGTTFQGSYKPNPNWQFFVPNLLPRAQMASLAVLSEYECFVIQHEKASKRERQELENMKLEVKRKALQLQKSPQVPAAKTGPRVKDYDTGDVELDQLLPLRGAVEHIFLNSRQLIEQNVPSLSLLHPVDPFPPLRTTHEGPIL